MSRIRRVAARPAPEETAGPMPEGGADFGSAGWLMVQARAAQEPGWIARGGYGGGIPLLPFAPPYSGGIGGMGDIPLPVPEAPGWLMLGFGALLVGAAGRRYAKKP